ncbi:MAG: carboxypeptidase regulatory-like domain-containing protein [Planctomycetaceae bacterium]|nr:carboxypeptidase regulatory-like domain-containing protein [Planctomycetaceae bacterium]MCA9032250.1 carboxypeptidase regulatory-like domain-containing protein [Planctomycetaceae bacterium]MCA9043476.1 carboxypeptidase regulatory-like domain-containing protein [Planctomycetaceae bacterium]MCB9950804.1 carboxypeptidase regulatory-like domain-containing protein [Planctomycetaceae bacterium]
MFRSKFAFTLAAIAATMMVAPPQMFAQDRMPNQDLARDIALDASGALNGQVVDSQGKPLDGALVAVFQSEKQVKRVTSDESGRFQVDGLRNGLYTLEVAGNEYPVRLWSAQVAPPSAKAGATLVFGEPSARGQFGFLDPVNTSILLLGVAGVTLSAVSLNEINQLDKRIDRNGNAIIQNQNSLDQLDLKVNNLLQSH